jgi:hypothetical protein
MIRCAVVAPCVVVLGVVTACSSSSPTPFAPADAGAEADAAADAAPPCVTVFSEDFREGLGAFTAESSADGSVAVFGSYLRGTFSTTPAATSFARGKATATFASPKKLRVFYTSQISKWERDTRATIGCRVSLPGGKDIDLALSTRAGMTEDEMRVTLGGETIEGLIGPDERHVVAIVVEPNADRSKATVDLLWDGVTRGKLVDVPLDGVFDRVTLTCGVVAIETAPTASAEPPFAAVDDVSVVACP